MSYPIGVNKEKVVTVPNEKWFVKTIKRLQKEEGFSKGWEGALDFNHGIIRGWLAAKLISRKFANELIDNFAKYPDDDDDWYDGVKNKYGRILA